MVDLGHGLIVLPRLGVPYIRKPSFAHWPRLGPHVFVVVAKRALLIIAYVLISGLRSGSIYVDRETLLHVNQSYRKQTIGKVF